MHAQRELQSVVGVELYTARLGEVNRIQRRGDVCSVASTARHTRSRAPRENDRRGVAVVP